MVDQGGTTHAYDFDKLGRQTQDRVTALGIDVDGAVRRIASTYEVRGMRQLLTSYDNAAVGSGSVLNQSQFVYNDFSQLVTEYQAHEGSVNTSTTAKVQYTFASGSANTIRATGMVYPSGRVLTYSYGTTGGQSDRLSRVVSYIDDDGTSHIIDYTFLGAGTFVESDRPQPSLKWSIITDQGGTDPNTGDIYRGLDRFGRVTDNQWFGYGTGSNVDVDRIRYGYDRAGNRIWRENPVATSFSKEFDEIYSYDALHRLKDMARGRLNTARTALTSTTFAQCWTLDSTGNWQGFREDDTGSGTWDLVQARTANDVNEIAGITNSVGAAWVQPAYSPAGNMTTMPQPNDPTNGYTVTYDAWNRLVKIVDTPTSNTVSEYAYDGAKRQIRQRNYAAGTLSETRHLYYTDPASWRCLEERLGTTPDTATPDSQYIWGERYIDDLILRDRNVMSSSSSAGGDGPNPLGQRLFACQDASWNVSAVSSETGDIYERFYYSAFGATRTLTNTFEYQLVGSLFGHRYAGGRYDATIGAYSMRHRFFHPILGVWGQQDPLRGPVSLRDRFSSVLHSVLLADNLNARGTLSRRDISAIQANVNVTPHLLYAYCVNRPLIHVDPFGLEAEVCCRPTRIPVLGSVLGMSHCWLKTETESTGRGTYPDKCCNSCFCASTRQTDHSSEQGDCRSPEEWYAYDFARYKIIITSCSESCINDEMEAGRDVGRFFPLVADCNAWVRSVLDKCCEFDPMENYPMGGDWGYW